MQNQGALAIPSVAFAKASQIDEVQRLLWQLHDLSKQTYVMPSTFAWIYCCHGEIELGIEWAEKAIDQHDSLIIPTYFPPIYDPLLSHHRYKTLLRKMNLEP